MTENIISTAIVNEPDINEDPLQYKSDECNFCEK